MISTTMGTSAPLPAHVRVKRMKQTYFVSVDLREGTVQQLRDRAAFMMNVHPSELRLCRFCTDGTTPDFLEDEQTLAECALKNDEVIHAVLLKGGDWEVPYITPYAREKRPLARR